MLLGRLAEGAQHAKAHAALLVKVCRFDRAPAEKADYCASLAR